MRPGIARRPEYRPRRGDRQTRSVGTITVWHEPCRALSHHIGSRSNLHPSAAAAQPPLADRVARLLTLTKEFFIGRHWQARFRDMVQAVFASVTIPVSVKLPASLNSPGQFAATPVGDRASGFVLFNWLPEPGPLRLMLVDRRALSEPDEIRLPLLWTALLSGRIDVSLAASGGVASVNDAVKYLLAGADVVMAASALPRYGA